MRRSGRHQDAAYPGAHTVIRPVCGIASQLSKAWDAPSFEQSPVQQNFA